MAEFLVELYVSRSIAGGAEPDVGKLRRSAEGLARGGKPVRHLRTIFVPEDETCYVLYEAASADVLHAVAQRAGVVLERIAEAAPQGTREELLPCA
jgi:hypothetical protein